jgi:probable addiction module antidote protein
VGAAKILGRLQKKKGSMKPAKNYRESLLRDLKEPKEAVAYLNAALETGSKAGFLLALRNVLDAQGGMSKFSRHANLNRVSLYRMLSKTGNPELESLIALLGALGIKFQVVVDSKSKQKAA